ncbi:hypothetical protein [uncultured Sphingomonas sp.]|uniref:hypothetical protein n=1 Tax=uncultured Sphingomonas sp. TaxID=158754 RepID=UPI0035CB6870
MGEHISLYMRLLDEGVDVWRPVEAESLPSDGYRILGPVPDGETWEFQPGAIVRGQQHRFSGGEQGIVAVSR